MAEEIFAEKHFARLKLDSDKWMLEGACIKRLRRKEPEELRPRHKIVNVIKELLKEEDDNEELSTWQHIDQTRYSVKTVPAFVAVLRQVSFLWQVLIKPT